MGGSARYFKKYIFALYGFQTKVRLLITTLILVLFIAYHSHTYPHKNKLVNIQELLLLFNLTIMYAVSYQYSETLLSQTSWSIWLSFSFVQQCCIISSPTHVTIILWVLYKLCSELLWSISQRATTPKIQIIMNCWIYLSVPTIILSIEMDLSVMTSSEQFT